MTVSRIHGGSDHNESEAQGQQDDRSVDAALVQTRWDEGLIGGVPYLTGLVGSRLVESLDGGLTWQYWTGE